MLWVHQVEKVHKSTQLSLKVKVHKSTQLSLKDPGADVVGSSSLSSGCSTRWCRDSSDAHVAAARHSVLLLPLFACSRPFGHLHAWVSLVKKIRFLVRIFDQFQTDF